MKVYARVRENSEYHSYNIAHVIFGFRELDAEIIKYTSLYDIYSEVTSEDIVLDYIDQCNIIFNKFSVKLNVLDYPEELRQFLGRGIWKDTINSIVSNETKWSAGNFVKPVKNKVFTGKIISSIADLVGCGSCYEDYEVYVSEPVNIKAEWRCFILYDEIIDVRPYGFSKDSWRYNYKLDTVCRMLDAFKTWETRPIACSMDIAVIMPEWGVYKTILVEFNDAYALGNYGLSCLQYAKLISARWSQLLNREDIYHF